MVEAHFARHLAEARDRGREPLASLPDAATIEAVIDAAFWASLRREEGYVPKISLAYLSPEEAVHPLLFERPMPLEPAALTRVAPAVERPGIHLGVWHDGSELAVWGTTRTTPTLCFVLEVSAPGLLVVKHHSGEESGKFVNVAVIEGDQVKVVDEQASQLPGCPALLTSLLGFDSPGSWVRSVNVLVQLAVSMRAHEHGGSLLVVPSGSESWRESIVWPMPYAVLPPFSELAILSREIPREKEGRGWQEALGRTVEAIAGLTAVDGAVVLTDGYELLGFGAKIGGRKGCPQVDQVTVTEPVLGGTPAVVHPEQLGGTRHLSATQFVQDQRDAVALVASQDGRFTIFEWSPCEAMVHAHRIEALLL
ncbi:MAG: hypothetical protein LAP87_01050 [Acidobacteriia bacterium]|nr:hypothetical protein [Terriglobia bacterium]